MPPTPTMRPMPRSSLKAASSRISIRAGRRGSAAMISSPSRSTARMARPSPGCTNASPSIASTRRSRCGTPTSRRRWTSWPIGTRCRTIGRPITASRRNGRCSCAMSPRTRHGRSGSKRARRACNSRRSACKAGASGGGLTSRRSPSEGACDGWSGKRAGLVKAGDERAAACLSINLATTRGSWGFGEAVDGCLRHDIRAIAPWRDQVDAIGLAEASRIVHSNGIRVTGLCRGGMFPADTAAGRQAAIDDNRRAIDEAASLGAECLVLVVGGLPGSSRDIDAARGMVADGIAAMLPHARACGVPLAIEPLHPMYAADRACVNTLDQALDLCDRFGAGVGVAIDVYHVWWDPNLAERDRAGRPHGLHSGPPYLRLAGADTRPAARSRHDGGWCDRPEAHSRPDRGGRLSRSAGGRDLLERRIGGSGRGMRSSASARNVSPRFVEGGQ